MIVCVATGWPLVPGTWTVILASVMSQLVAPGLLAKIVKVTVSPMRTSGRSREIRKVGLLESQLGGFWCA